MYLPQELQRGADGAMTGFAFPEMLAEVVSLHNNRETKHAEDLYDTYLPLVRYEQQHGFGLAVRKEILRRRGAVSCAMSRAPGPVLTKRGHVELDQLIDRINSRLKEH